MRLRTEIVVEVPDEIGETMLRQQEEEAKRGGGYYFSNYYTRDDGWSYRVEAPLVWAEVQE